MRAERGQSTVEFALILPLVFVLILGFVQVGAVVSAQIQTTHVAREVARTLAVEPEADPAAVAASAATLDPDRLDIDISFEPASVPGRRFVVVRLTYEPATVNDLVPTINVTAEAAMLVEE